MPASFEELLVEFDPMLGEKLTQFVRGGDFSMVFLLTGNVGRNLGHGGRAYAEGGVASLPAI